MEDISGSGITGHLHFVQMVSTLYFTMHFTNHKTIILLSITGPDPLVNHKDISGTSTLCTNGKYSLFHNIFCKITKL